MTSPYFLRILRRRGCRSDSLPVEIKNSPIASAANLAIGLFSELCKHNKMKGRQPNYEYNSLILISISKSCFSCCPQSCPQFFTLPHGRGHSMPAFTALISPPVTNENSYPQSYPKRKSMRDENPRQIRESGVTEGKRNGTRCVSFSNIKCESPRRGGRGLVVLMVAYSLPGGKPMSLRNSSAKGIFPSASHPALLRISRILLLGFKAKRSTHYPPPLAFHLLRAWRRPCLPAERQPWLWLPA